MRARALVLAAALFSAGAGAATTVKVLQIAADRVDLLVNGNVIRTLYAGQVSPEGVYLAELRQDMAIVEVDGRRWQMRLGSSTTTSVVLQADPSGHFYVNALVNGVALRALVDTGATAIALNQSQARQLGLDLSGARRVMVNTAGGPRQASLVNLSRVQVGEITLANVATVVHDRDELPVALLGMSFLNQVDMQRSGTTLTLTRRY